MSELMQASDADFQEFILAIKSGAEQKVQDMLKIFSPEIVNKIQAQFRQPPLYFAALAPGGEIAFRLMSILINTGANVNFKDQNEQTVMFYVCREGREKCLEKLLEHGLTLEEVDLYGQTPLFYVASENRINIVHKFNSKQINRVDKLAGQTPLYYAARKGHLEMCKALIERGADVTVLDNLSKTAIEYAKKAKFTEVAEYLNSELKKVKDISKAQGVSHSVNDESMESKKKRKEDPKLARMAYKIVHMNQKGESHDLTEDEVHNLLKGKPILEGYFANPDTIPQEEIEAAQGECWEKVAQKILTHISKLKGAYWFMDPVDPVKYNIMDYFDIVSHPMDLGTIRRKLQHNCYPTAQSFKEDMELVWGNCYKYNGDTHEISQCAKEIEMGFAESIRHQGLERYL